jgi:DNA anti-recombination protein RmuC
MRDIRSDLQERAKLLEEQIKAVQAQFDKYVEQMTNEHGSRIKDLNAELDAVKMLMGIEHRRHSGAPAMTNGQPQAQKPKPQQPAPNESSLRASILDTIGMRRAV